MGAPRKILRGIAIGVAVTFIAAFLLSVWLFPALHFLRSYRERLTLEYPPKLPPHREMRMEEAALSVRLYFSGSSGATVIIIPGLHPFGIDDPRFAAFAQAIAEQGFNVITPDIVELRELRLTQRSVEQLVRLVQFLPKYIPELSLKNLGLVGISFGAGPVFLAAADPTVKLRINFLVSIGGYYDLPQVMMEALESKDPWGRMILTLEGMDQLIPDPDASRLQESLRSRLNLKEKTAELQERALSEQGRAFLKEVLEGFSPKYLAQFQEMIQKNKSELEKLSPATILQDLNPELHIYLLHGKNDALIPYQQTVALQRRLEEIGHPHVNTLIAGSLLHVEWSSHPGSFFDKLRLLSWTRRLLNERKTK